jgi:hypothetical protein
MVGLVIVFAVAWIWIIYEIKNAPLMDDYGNIIEDKNDNNKKK